ncbi:MAG: biotin--[acetyl-CoA-carboxylase] ligase [Chloroflexota bacterium]|jgi:BirA family transcriptional regulator, biotin operon repressor / biotin---[acetyl-CoA-carboxylase] ligase
MTASELNEAAVQAALASDWLGRTYHYVESIGSTNDRLKEWLAGGRLLPEGTVLLADYQSAGRGRLDRRWEAPPRTSLLFSVLLRPGWPPEQGSRLTMLASVAVAEAIEAVAGVEVRLKWPNDIMVEHDMRWRKAGGLLNDATIDADGTLATAIMGIGLNVNIPADYLPAGVTLPTSLWVARGQPVARLPLLVACLGRLEHHYDEARRGHSPWPAWNTRLLTLGRPVTVTGIGSGESIIGLAEASDETGRLIVRDESGQRHAVTAGDVTLRQD